MFRCLDAVEKKIGRFKCNSGGDSVISLVMISTQNDNSRLAKLGRDQDKFEFEVH